MQGPGRQRHRCGSRAQRSFKNRRPPPPPAATGDRNPDTRNSNSGRHEARDTRDTRGHHHGERPHSTIIRMKMPNPTKNIDQHKGLEFGIGIQNLMPTVPPRRTNGSGCWALTTPLMLW